MRYLSACCKAKVLFVDGKYKCVKCGQVLESVIVSNKRERRKR